MMGIANNKHIHDLDLFYYLVNGVECGNCGG
jgi:hypothetical protein